MKFWVVPQIFDASVSQFPCVVLISKQWNDHGHRTLFDAYLATGARDYQALGHVKILQHGQSQTVLPPHFESLDEQYASLGQDLSYYRNLKSMVGAQASTILDSLRDIVNKRSIVATVDSEPGLEKSLLRLADARIAYSLGMAILTGEELPRPDPPRFVFSCHLDSEHFSGDHELDVRFDNGPRMGRMMALVGRNGTGKTRLLAALASALSGLDTERGTLSPPETSARVVAISFNPFDRFTIPFALGDSYVYYGLRTRPPRGQPLPFHVDVDAAFNRLVRSLKAVAGAGRRKQDEWLRMVRDANIFEREIGLSNPFDGSFDGFIKRLRSASAGHQLLILVITAIVESVRPGTVILFDEPETHLHPNLTSTLLRILYDALERNDAYALLATHSPVVVQEIPSAFVRIIRLDDRMPWIDRYDRESFGENIDSIVAHAFGVDERDKSYVSILEDLARSKSRDEVEALFDGQLGLGARLLLRHLYSPKKGS